MAIDLTTRQRRWLDTLLILATVAAGFVVAGFTAQLVFGFGDILLVFFLAWLLAFILSPMVGYLAGHIPYLNRLGAVVIVYALLLGGLVLLVVLIAGALASSIAQFIQSVPSIRSDLPSLLAPWQQRLADLGLGQVDLAAQASVFLGNLDAYARELAGPLQQLAVASLGALGNLLLVVVLSLFMVADRDRILSFLFRVVPPGFKEEARLLESSVARSFGGFLRAQAILGGVYAAVSVVASVALRLDFLPVTAAASGLLMMIPFFGPFVAWLPPVLVALFFQPAATVPVLVIMGVGWLIVMNVLQPRLMEEAVGIHPIIVLGSVLVGSKIAGVTGAIFGIPIAAVLSAFFFHYLGRSHDTRPVAHRAADRLEAREGRPIRVPREPAAGLDPEVEGAAAQATPPVTRSASPPPPAATR